jgi:hypothetical protein
VGLARDPLLLSLPTFHREVDGSCKTVFSGTYTLPRSYYARRNAHGERRYHCWDLVDTIPVLAGESHLTPSHDADGVLLMDNELWPALMLVRSENAFHSGILLCLRGNR